jgi:vacuolar-type H+-ATPase subunit I/STV1
MRPDLVKTFIDEYHREINRLRASVDIERAAREREAKQIDQGIRRIIESIKAGFRTDAMREELETLEARKKALMAKSDDTESTPVRLHPTLAADYRARVEQLREQLDREDTRMEAAEILRGLVDEIRVIPEGAKLKVHLKGNLAAVLALGQGKRPKSQEFDLQSTLVAGAGNQRFLQLAEAWL